MKKNIKKLSLMLLVAAFSAGQISFAAQETIATTLAPAMRTKLAGLARGLGKGVNQLARRVAQEVTIPRAFLAVTFAPLFYNLYNNPTLTREDSTEIREGRFYIDDSIIEGNQEINTMYYVDMSNIYRLDDLKSELEDLIGVPANEIRLLLLLNNQWIDTDDFLRRCVDREFPILVMRVSPEVVDNSLPG